MSDRVYPASRPPRTTNYVSAGAPPQARPPAHVAVNGNERAIRMANQKAPANLPQEPPPENPQKPLRRRSCRRLCCCCCFWSILIILILALLAAIAAIAMYVIYHPRSPSFSVPSLRIGHVNLTTASDSSLYHLSSSFNFTLLSENPNKHLTFSYNPFAVTVISEKSGAMLGTGTIQAFFSDNGNKTTFRGVIATSSPERELDPEEARNLNSDLTRPRVGFEIQMRADVKMQMGMLKSEGVEIKVTCQGFEGTLPKGKTPTVATSENTKCKSDLRVKVWRWSF